MAIADRVPAVVDQDEIIRVDRPLRFVSSRLVVQ
jgi:hypothetical protein